MNTNLNGKIALVTGAERGLGYYTALRLAKNGADVAIHYVFDADKAQAVVREIEAFGRCAIAVRANFTSESEMRDMMAQVRNHFGAVDILVNNAGAVIQRLNFMDMEHNVDQLWIDSFYINYMYVVRTMREFLPDMCKKGWGRVINISSVSCRIRAAHGATVHYSPMKHALESLSEQVSYEVAKYGVTVNCVAPGNMTTELLKDSPLPNPDIQKYYHVGRSAHPDEVAAAIEFLASSDASNITGETYYVSGGR